MTDASHAEHQSAVVVAEDNTSVATDNANSVPADYKDPVCWPGGQPHATGAAHASHQYHPQAGRMAQNQWTFTMTGGISHHVPQEAWLAMNNEQQRAFDSAGRLPITRSGNSNATMQIAGAGPFPPLAIEAGSGGGSGQCSGCGGTGSKRFPTHAGLMRPLCGNCVYDRVGGDQAAYAAEWAKGRPM